MRIPLHKRKTASTEKVQSGWHETLTKKKKRRNRVNGKVLFLEAERRRHYAVLGMYVDLPTFLFNKRCQVTFTQETAKFVRSWQFFFSFRFHSVPPARERTV